MKKYYLVIFLGCIFCVFYFFKYNKVKNQSLAGEPKSFHATSSGSSNRRFVEKNNISSLRSDENHIKIPASAGAINIVSSLENSNAVWSKVNFEISDMDKIESLIGAGQSKAAFDVVKLNIDVLNRTKEGDIIEINIPDSVAVDVVVTTAEENDNGRSIIGHLSNFPEPYYFGLSYDAAGNVVGEITTEKANYAIRTYLKKTIIFKVLPDPEKFKTDDF